MGQAFENKDSRMRHLSYRASMGLVSPVEAREAIAFQNLIGGERAGARTQDLLIKSQLLYRLSYALPGG